MISINETVHLEPGEDIIALFRRHGSTVFVTITPYALLIVLLFLFIFPLFSLGVRGVALFGVLCLIFCLLGLRKIVAWLGTITVLTSRRLLVIQRYGFFKKKVNEIKLDQVSEISYEVKGMLPTVGRYGTLFLLVTFTSAMVSIPDIPDPQSALNVISQAIGKVARKTAVPPPPPPETVVAPNTAKTQHHPSFHVVERKDPANWK